MKNALGDFVKCIPSYWEEIPLKYLCEIDNSGSYGENPGESETDVPVCTTAHITSDGRLLIDEMPIRSFSEKDAQRYIGKSGDIFIVKSSGSNTNIISGKLAVIGDETGRVVFSNFLFRIRPNQRVKSSFLALFLRSFAMRERIKKMVSTTTYPNINIEEYASSLIPLPPLDEQVVLVESLGKLLAPIDQVAGAADNALNIITEKRRAIIAKAVTKGLDQNVPMLDSGIPWLGMVPAHWTSTKIGRLFKHTKRLGFSDLTVLSVYREYGVIERASRDDNANKLPEDLEKYQLVEIGDLVVNKMKAWQGSLGISDFLGITSPDYVVFQPSHKELPTFLHYRLRASLMTSVYLSISNGIRTSQWRIEPDRFLDLPIFLPDIAEQKLIVNHIQVEIAKLDDLAEATKKTIALLQERRSALISAAVTGQMEGL